MDAENRFNIFEISACISDAVADEDHPLDSSQGFRGGPPVFRPVVAQSAFAPSRDEQDRPESNERRQP
jgi:hypothetical protein